MRFVGGVRDSSLEGDKPILISSRIEKKHDLTSRTMMNQVRRSGTKIARLTSEYKAITFNLRQSHGVRRIRSRPDAILKIPFNLRAVERKLQRISKRIKDLGRGVQLVNLRTISSLYSPVKRIPLANTSHETDLSTLSLRKKFQTVPIRHVNNSLEFERRIIHVGMIRIALHVSDMTGKYRTIMHTIRQRDRRRKKTMALTQYKAFYRPLGEYTIPKLLDSLLPATDSVESITSMLQNELEVILGTILIGNGYKSKTRSSPDAEAALEHTNIDMAKISGWVSLRAYIASSANASALSIQNLDNALNWLLGYMARDRIARQRSLWSWKQSRESHICVLRKYLDHTWFLSRPRLTQQAFENNLITNEIRDLVRKKFGDGMDAMAKALRKLYQRKKAIQKITLQASSTTSHRKHRVITVRRVGGAVHNPMRRIMTLRRIRIDLRGRRATYWAKKMQKDAFESQVGSWLSLPKETTQPKDDLGLVIQAPREEKVFGQRYMSKEDVDTEGMGDGLALLLATAKQQEGTTKRDKRKK